MTFQHIAGAAYRALTARKDGPSLYDVCDPLLLNYRGGDPHLGKFYKTALGNPALRPLLRADRARRTARPRPLCSALREALIRARDDASPDWAAIGQPVADAARHHRAAAPEPRAARRRRGARPTSPRSKP